MFFVFSAVVEVEVNKSSQLVQDFRKACLKAVRRLLFNVNGAGIFK